MFGTLLILLVDVLCGSFYFISFASLSLQCNRAVLTLVSIAKENEGGMSLALTDAAAARVRHLLQQRQRPFLKLGVKICSQGLISFELCCQC